jgi:DNA-binding CsgD family transcriptional regulator
LKTTITLGPKDEQLLALLAEGASTRVVARRMAHSEGTVRVYLHRLYRAIGVRNRTQAVLWHLNRGRASSAPPAAAAASLEDESFGDVARREGLLNALGIMESFLGPYGRMWQAGARLKGGGVDGQALARRDQARVLWRALLAGDFACGKRLDDERMHAAPKAPAAEDVLLALLLELGGYSRAAERLASSLARARAGQGVTAREMQLLRALRDVLQGKSGGALASLQRITAQPAAGATVRQMALATIFHVGHMQKDAAAARSAADALWADAEAARSQLEAMGLRLVPRSAGSTSPRHAGSPAAISSGKQAETAR